MAAVGDAGRPASHSRQACRQLLGCPGQPVRSLAPLAARGTERRTGPHR